MRYYLGIDGGGTKTKIIIINEDEHILYENVAGPSSVDTVDTDTTIANITLAIEPYMKENNAFFTSVFAGLGGIVKDKQKERVSERLRALPFFSTETKVVVENDMFNALYSGAIFDEGMVLIVGTGMVAFGKDHTGKQVKCGGWGHKEGDLGSGFHLGIAAVRYMIRAYDGRLPLDDFAKQIAHEVGLNETTDIIDVMDRLYFDRTKVASLAPIVREYANINHPYALQIINEATDELVLAVQGVVNQLQLKKQELVIVGSLGNIDGALKTMLHKKLLHLFPNLTILVPQIDPALAAALMAKRLA